MASTENTRAGSPQSIVLGASRDSALRMKAYLCLHAAAQIFAGRQASAKQALRPLASQLSEPARGFSVHVLAIDGASMPPL
jgi:hypothetical protein